MLFLRLVWALPVLFMFQLPAWAEAEEASLWPVIKENFFGNRVIHEGASDYLSIEAPMRAEDAAIVPITITAHDSSSVSPEIAKLHLFIDNNPMPHAASFELSPSLETVNLSTRVRVDSYTPVRVVAEMRDSSLHMVQTFVKASGGCSAPAGKDQSAALARMGKMQIRMRQPTIGTPTQVQVIVSHPNNSGLQMDQQTRGYIPAHFVETMNISYNDEPLIKMTSGISMSEDPSLRFVFTPDKPGLLKAEVTDSKAHFFHQQKQL
jgi:sulfur-oxidizing protein SoxY